MPAEEARFTVTSIFVRRDYFDPYRRKLNSLREECGNRRVYQSLPGPRKDLAAYLSLIKNVGAANPATVSLQAFDKAVTLMLAYLEERIDSRKFSKSAREMISEYPVLKSFFPYFRAADIILSPMQSYPGLGDPVYSFIQEDDYLLVGDRALTTLPLSIDHFTADVVRNGKRLDEKAMISGELYDAFRRAASCSMRTECEDRALAHAMVNDDLPDTLSQIEIAQELLLAMFQRTPFRKMSTMSVAGEPQRDVTAHNPLWDLKEFWGQARVRHQGERLIIVRFRRRGWTYLFTPIESSMVF